MSPVNLGLPLGGVSTNIKPEGITLHYGGPSHWTGANRKSGALFFKSTNHKRCPTVVRAWHAYHLSKGWAGLAYTSVVCPHGTVYEGRGKGRRTAANGTSEGNLRSYAVCYLAGDDDPLTDQAKRAFLSEQKRLGTKLRWVHRQWKKTDCPGKPIEAWKATRWRSPSTNNGVTMKKLERRIAAQETMLGLVGGRLQKFEGRLDRVEARTKKVEKRLHDQQNMMSLMGARFDKIEKRVGIQK